jgi:hypothetical protein
MPGHLFFTEINLLTADGLKAHIAKLQQKGDLTDEEVLHLISGALVTSGHMLPDACRKWLMRLASARRAHDRRSHFHYF